MEEKQGHTPGEWKVFQCLSSETMLPGRGIEIDGKSYWLGLDTHNAEANARLIAAAPDLLGDGQFLLDRLDEFANELQDDEVARQFYGHVAPALARLRASTNKATGGPDAK